MFSHLGIFGHWYDNILIDRVHQLIYDSDSPIKELTHFTAQKHKVWKGFLVSLILIDSYKNTELWLPCKLSHFKFDLEVLLFANNFNK